MNRLSYYLQRVPAITVVVDFNQVVGLIGIDKAEELCDYKVSSNEIRTKPYNARSLVPENKRIRKQQLASFNRSRLIAAIKEAEGNDFKQFVEKKANPLPTDQMHLLNAKE